MKDKEVETVSKEEFNRIQKLTMERYEAEMQGAEICENPTCGADREVVFQGMTEGYESDNAQYSIKIIKNCQACKEAYREHIANLEELCNNIP